MEALWQWSRLSARKKDPEVAGRIRKIKKDKVKEIKIKGQEVKNIIQSLTIKQIKCATAIIAMVRTLGIVSNPSHVRGPRK